MSGQRQVIVRSASGQCQVSVQSVSGRRRVGARLGCRVDISGLCRGRVPGWRCVEVGSGSDRGRIGVGSESDRGQVGVGSGSGRGRIGVSSYYTQAVSALHGPVAVYTGPAVSGPRRVADPPPPAAGASDCSGRQWPGWSR